MPDTLAPADLPPYGLTWQIKESFMRYLGYLPDASISVDQQAQLLDIGAFNFPAMPEVSRTPQGGTQFTFRGSIALLAHQGLLNVNFADPLLTVHESSAKLQVKTGHCADFIDVCAAHDGAFRSHGTDLLWSSHNVHLSPEAVTLFGSQYPAGTALAPLLVRLAVPA